MAHSEIIFADSAVRTASGTGASTPIKTATMLDVAVNITAASGVTPKLSVWIEWSPDSGTAWYAKAADHVLQSKTDGTAMAVTEAGLICLDQAATGSFVANYKHFAAGYARVRYTISGTGPSFTFSVKASAK